MDDIDDVRLIGFEIVLRFLDIDKREFVFCIDVGGVDDELLLLFIVFNDVRFPFAYSLRNSSIFSSKYGSCPSICKCSCNV